MAAASASAAAWLALVDAGRYEVSWDSAAILFRRVVTQPGWKEALQKARAPFEPLGTRTLVSSSFHTALPGAPPGEYVVLQYETTTGGGRAVLETVTPTRDQDGRWRVSGYYIRPR